jgi:hypothetical protein
MVAMVPPAINDCSNLPVTVTGPNLIVTDDSHRTNTSATTVTCRAAAMSPACAPGPLAETPGHQQRGRLERDHRITLAPSCRSGQSGH